MNNRLRKIIIFFLFPLVIFFMFFIIYESKTINIYSGYFYDEYAWIGRSFYSELLLKGDFNNELWKTYKIDGDPKLTSYIYGFFLYPDYLREKKLRGKNYDMVQYLIDHNFYESKFLNTFSRNKYNKYLTKNFIVWKAGDSDGLTLEKLLKNYGNGFEKTIKTIFRARLGAISFLSLSVVVVYFIFIFTLHNYPLSFLMTFLYGFSSFTTSYGVIAYSESIYLFFFNLILLNLIWFTSNKKQNFVFIIISIIICAFLNQTKLNGILFLPLIILILTIDSFRKCIKTWLIKIFFIVHLFIIIFIISNPFLYSNTMTNIIFQYGWTYKTALGQQQHSLYREEVLFNIKDRFDFINRSLLKDTSRALMPFTIKNSIFTFLFMKFVKIFFILGLIKSILIFFKEKYLTAKKTIFTAFIFFYISLLAYLMLAWDRYLVHMVFFIFYLVGEGILFSFEIIKYLRSKFEI